MTVEKNRTGWKGSASRHKTRPNKTRTGIGRLLSYYESADSQGNGNKTLFIQLIVIQYLKGGIMAGWARTFRSFGKYLGGIYRRGPP